MATWNVVFPEFIDTSTGQIRNKRVAIDPNSDRVTVTIWAQVVHNVTAEVAGERSFSYSGSKSSPGVYAEAVRDLAKDIDGWSDNIREAISLRQGPLANLEDDISMGLTT